MKRRSNGKERIRNGKLERKLVLLFICVGILPLGLLSAVTLYRMMDNSIQFQKSMLEKEFERAQQSVEELVNRIDKTASLVSVSEQVRETLIPGRDITQVEELKEFEEISRYTYEVEMNGDDVYVLYYIDDSFVISKSMSTCFRPVSSLEESGILKEMKETNGKSVWHRVEERNRYGQKEEFVADFRPVWNEKNYSQIIGAVAVLMPVKRLESVMEKYFTEQMIFLENGNGEVLVSDGEILENAEEKCLIRRAELDTDMLRLIFKAPESVIAQDQIHIVIEMLPWYVGIICLMIVVAVPVFRQILRGQYALGKEKSEAQLQALQAQINPHFLYNTLDMVNWMAVKNEGENIQMVMQAMSRFYRLVLSGGENIITIDKEIQMCEAYMKIQVMRQRQNIQFQTDIEENIRSCLIPQITLQPLLENAMIHGIGSLKNGTGYILLSGWEKENRIYLQIADNGIGIEKENLRELQKSLGTARERLKKEEADKKSGSHYGLWNIKRRLSLYYGEEIRLDIKSSVDTGTSVTICIPRRENKE